MNRCSAFLRQLDLSGFDAALIHRPENMRYLTGFTGEGCILIGTFGTLIITDFRYVELAERQCRDCTVRQTERGHSMPQIVSEALVCHHLQKLGIETDYLSYDDVVTFKEALLPFDVEPLGKLIESMRRIKDASEIDCIRKACTITERAFERLLPQLHVDMTEREVQILLDYEMLMLGSEKNAFDTIAAAGVHGSLPHAVPGDYVIRRGDLLTLDFGAVVGGYCADMTRTVAFGPIRNELKDMYHAVLTAQQMALDAIRPGVTGRNVDAVARDYLEERYPGAFGHSLGHSIGLQIHEKPLFSPREDDVILPGMVITVEPGVYLPNVGGCRIEDTVIITAEGYGNCFTATKQLIEL